MQAALDVFNVEPPPADSPLVNRQDVVCTPHLGASTTEAQEGVAVEIADAVIGALKVRLSWLHCTNLCLVLGSQEGTCLHSKKHSVLNNKLDWGCAASSVACNLRLETSSSPAAAASQHASRQCDPVQAFLWAL